MLQNRWIEKNSYIKSKGILRQDDFVDTSAGDILTKTEKKVLKLILEGKGNKQIAFALGRALRTVELHRSHIMHKFGADSLVALVKKTAALDMGDLS